ncbi:response regulator [Kitasatospora kifunensis]|uniref:DNA-binding NarL/FixJ family response regulator n=1 Tax=Kitasatospora kifunensis TaxID=58351 RepID=A0A7W7VWD3_KITKI|nr:response regulator transcription factor [Kitasatospora kifunensis]MBB4924420.1 DNA-binding NarL/FixJ family response regulator [Kitasatospora kifunensis]
MTAIRVLIVDDELLVRSGLGLIVGSAPDLELVGDCSGGEAEELVRRLRPHVVLLDVRMPDLDGISVLRRLRALPEPPAVSMLTTFDTDEYIGTALRAGAAGFLLKDTAPDQLVHAVRILAAGGSMLSPAVTRTVIGGFVEGGGPDAAALTLVRSLTGRELDVLALLGEGLANAEIADRLFLGTGTVKDHISAILSKLGAANRVQAAVIAHRAGLVRPTGQ